MKHTRTVSLLLAVLLLSTACQTRGKENMEQSTADTVITEVTCTDGTAEPTGAPTDAPTEPTSEETEPSETPTEPDSPAPEPKEPVTIIGTYDSVEEVFADYEKRYVTYGKGENNYDTVCKELQKDDSIEDQYIAFIFTDIDDFGFLAHVYRDFWRKSAILFKRAFVFNTLYQINGWYEETDRVELYGGYDLYGGSTLAVGNEVVAFACERNAVPILFYNSGYFCPLKDEQYSGQLFYFTEENSEVKYDWERWDLNGYWGDGLESWLNIMTSHGMNGTSIMRHSGTIILKDGQPYLAEEEITTLDEWIKTCFHPDYRNNDFETTGIELLNSFGVDSIDELLSAYKTMSPEEWYEFTYPHLQD